MKGLSVWLVVGGFFAFLGSVLPWFHPVDPGVQTNTWHSWDDQIGLVVLFVGLLSMVAGGMLYAGLSGKWDVISAADYLDKMVFLPALGFAACLWVYFRLPTDDAVSTCYGSICDGGSSAWINDPGASRGVQFGWVLSLVACIAVLLGGLVLFVKREELTNKLADIYLNQQSSSTGSGHHRPAGESRSAIRQQRIAAKEAGLGPLDDLPGRQSQPKVEPQSAYDRAVERRRLQAEQQKQEPGSGSVG